MRVLVTGATGLLGPRLVHHLRTDGLYVIGHGRSPAAEFRADLTDAEAAKIAVRETHPDAIVHLVSLTSVDLCERNPDLAYRVNVRTLENLVDAVRSSVHKPHVVLISTDQVYDGPGANTEELVVLRNTYALTKLWAERVVGEISATILRTNFFGRSHTPGRLSLSDWVIAQATAQCEMKLVTDVHFSPLSIETLCAVIARVLEVRRPGVFNAGSREGMSKRDFAHRIAQRVGVSLAHARDAVRSDLSLEAPRPAGMIMDSSRFERTFGFVLPSLDGDIATAEL